MTVPGQGVAGICSKLDALVKTVGTDTVLLPSENRRDLDQRLPMNVKVIDVSTVDAALSAMFGKELGLSSRCNLL